MLIRAFLIALIFAAAIAAIGSRAAWRLTEPAEAERLAFRAAAPVIDIEARIQDLIEEVGTGRAGQPDADAEWRELIAYGAERVAEELEFDEDVEARLRRLVDEYDFGELTGGGPPTVGIADLAELDWRAFTYYVLAESTEIVSADAVTGIRTDAGDVRLDAVVQRIIEALTETGLGTIEAIPPEEIDLLGQTAELLNALGAAPAGERTEAQADLAEAARDVADLSAGIAEARRAAGIAAIAAAIAVFALTAGLAISAGWLRGIGFGALSVAAGAGMLAIIGLVVERQAPQRAAEAAEPVVESGWIIGEAAASVLFDEAIVVVIAAGAVAAAALIAAFIAARSGPERRARAQWE